MASRDGAPPRPPKPAPRPERQIAFGLGISAESRAAAWLIAHGYRILARLWKSPLGEIDIIAARRHTLIFVEVKARAKLDAAAEAIINRQKQRRSGGGGNLARREPDAAPEACCAGGSPIRSIPRLAQYAFAPAQNAS